MLGLPIDKGACQQVSKGVQTAMCTPLHAQLGHTFLPTASVCSVQVILRLGVQTSLTKQLSVDQGPDHCPNPPQPRRRHNLWPSNPTWPVGCLPMPLGMVPWAGMFGETRCPPWLDGESQSHSDGTDEPGACLKLVKPRCCT